MKNRNWLNVTEYLLLIGSGVGSVATAVSQQILFTAAPVSVLFLLNLVNRRRIEEAAQENTETSVAQLDQKLSDDLGSLQKQVQALPSFLDLANLRKTVQNTNQEAFTDLSKEIAEIKSELAKQNWHSAQKSIAQLQEQYTGLTDSITSVTTQLNRLTASTRVDSLEGGVAQLRNELSQLRVNLEHLGNEQKLNNFRVLQDQINHLNRRLNQLPTPFDPNSLKQDMNALMKAMGDMASRRDFSRLSGQVEQLSQQNEFLEQSISPLKISTNILRKQLDTVATRLHTFMEEADQYPQASSPLVIEDLKTTIRILERRLNQLPATADLTNMRAEVEGMVTEHLGQFQQQLANVQQVTHNLNRQHKDLQDWANRLPQILDAVALQNQVRHLTSRVEWAENGGIDVQAQVDVAVKHHLDEVMQQMRYQPAQYELVFDVKGSQLQLDAAVNGCASRAILEQALDAAEARLIIVYPYPTPETLSNSLIQRFRAFLDRQGCLDIGWGHLGHGSDRHTPRSIDRRRSIDPAEKGFLYETLNQLTQLKRQYPDQFRFKVLGTDENFLVCDRDFAILGTQSISTASAVFPQAAVGLRTIDPEVIQQLVARFDDPVLGDNDATAYFRRAITRYDLGDRQGAIADYTTVLQMSPHDDVAANNRGLAYYDLGDKQGAIADFELAVQYNPENFMAFYNRGFVRNELGDRLEAIEDYTFAIQINPDYAPAYFYRGLARTRMNNKLGAIEDYTEVLRLNPKNAAAYFYRGLACIKLGHRENATQDLELAAQLFAEQGEMAGSQQALKTLEKLQTSLAIATSDASLVSNSI